MAAAPCIAAIYSISFAPLYLHRALMGSRWMNKLKDLKDFYSLLGDSTEEENKKKKEKVSQQESPCTTIKQTMF